MELEKKASRLCSISWKCELSQLLCYYKEYNKSGCRGFYTYILYISLYLCFKKCVLPLPCLPQCMLFCLLFFFSFVFRWVKILLIKFNIGQTTMFHFKKNIFFNISLDAATSKHGVPFSEEEKMRKVLFKRQHMWF